MIDDLVAFGGTPEQVAALRAALAPQAEVKEAFVVEAENATAVRLLIALQTQWRTKALSTWSSAQLVRTGLDYGVVEITARCSGLDLSVDDFTRLRIAEAECLDAWAEEQAMAR